MNKVVTKSKQNKRRPDPTTIPDMNGETVPVSARPPDHVVLFPVRVRSEASSVTFWLKDFGSEGSRYRSWANPEEADMWHRITCLEKIVKDCVRLLQENGKPVMAAEIESRLDKPWTV